MKALLLNFSDDKGGAARAAYNLHQGLRSIGVVSRMLVGIKRGHDPQVLGPTTTSAKAIGYARPILDSLPLHLYSKRDSPLFSLQWLPEAVSTDVRMLAPDIINVHWICKGFMQIETLAKLTAPLVWTMHDVWPNTGGCHILNNCERYHRNCGACPQLGSSRERDLSRWVCRRKQRAWHDLDLTLVAPSAWLAECTRQSGLFRDSRIEVIPHGLDMQRFKPIDRRLARKWLNLPLDKKLVLFGSASGTSKLHKGFHLLTAALQHLSAAGWGEQMELVIFGPASDQDSASLGFRSHYLGRLSDDAALALLYAAADVTVIPSLQESFGMVAIESLACGTPAVCFATTGLRDAILHEQDGYLARPFATEDLAKGIAWILEDDERHKRLGDAARSRAKREFGQELQASRYVSLFSEILESR